MNNTFAGRVENWGTGINIVDVEGNDPDGAFYWAAKKAVYLASEATGAAAWCPSDGDVYLDFEGGDGGEIIYGLALGIIVTHLVVEGYPVLVVDCRDCPGCEHNADHTRDCSTCGGKGHVDNRAF